MILGLCNSGICCCHESATGRMYILQQCYKSCNKLGHASLQSYQFQNKHFDYKTAGYVYQKVSTRINEHCSPPEPVALI